MKNENLLNYTFNYIKIIIPCQCTFYRIKINNLINVYNQRIFSIKPSSFYNNTAILLSENSSRNFHKHYRCFILPTGGHLNN